MARRDEREYREYLNEEQRSQTGCSAGRMQLEFHHGLLANITIERKGRKGRKMRQHFFAALAAFAFHRRRRLVGHVHSVPIAEATPFAQGYGGPPKLQRRREAGHYL
jgi:hypothetical protein